MARREQAPTTAPAKARLEGRRDPIDRTIDSDPAEQGALGVPKELEESWDLEGLHTEDDDIDRMLDRNGQQEDDATVHRFEHVAPAHNPDPHVPEELAADIIALATQGGGSFLDDDESGALEEHMDRDAIAAGIVPQLVGQATLESAGTAEGLEEEEEDEDEESTTASTVPRAKPGSTGVHRIPKRGDR